MIFLKEYGVPLLYFEGRDGFGSRVLGALCFMFAKKILVPIQDSVNHTKIFIFQSISKLMRNTGRRYK